MVTISLRASLQILYNILSITTLEIFPTEFRATGFTLTISIGLIAGIGLPFFNELSIGLIILLLLICIAASISVFFLRETKHEKILKKFYTDIFENEPSNPIALS